MGFHGGQSLEEIYRGGRNGAKLNLSNLSYTNLLNTSFIIFFMPQGCLRHHRDGSTLGSIFNHQNRPLGSTPDSDISQHHGTSRFGWNT
jgi:hypothetical protein